MCREFFGNKSFCYPNLNRLFQTCPKLIPSFFQSYSKLIPNFSQTFPKLLNIFLHCQDLLVFKVIISSMKICYVLDASAFINGFQLTSDNNFTVPEITAEIKDFESRLKFDAALDDGLLTIEDIPEQYTMCVNDIIYESGDILRLSLPDKKLIALAYMLSSKGENVKVITDDYTIQNTLKIMNIPFSGVITEGIKGIYNWKKVCEGCKKEFPEDYPYDDCEICGSKIFKKRIKVNR